MNPALDIIEAVRALAENGGKSDRRIAALTLADPRFVTHAAIAEIATRVGVSEPTVTRFCRALGCEGMRDFKVRLAQALAVSGQYLQPVNGGPEPPGRRVPSLVGAGALEAVESVCRAVDLEALAQAAAILAGSRLIRAYGSGGSSSMAAIEFESRLFRLGLAASACIDGEMQRMTAAVADAGTTIVAFSISGLVAPQIEAVSIARHYGARTIAVTAPESPLAAAAALTFPFRIEEGANVFRPSPARYALLALIDMLAMATAEVIGPPAVEGMRRMKHHVSQARNNDPRLPLGD